MRITTWLRTERGRHADVRVVDIVGFNRGDKLCKLELRSGKTCNCYLHPQLVGSSAHGDT